MRKRSWFGRLLVGKPRHAVDAPRPGDELFFEPQLRRLEDRRVLAAGAIAVNVGTTPAGAVEGAAVALSGANFTDSSAGGNAPHTAQVDWGDGHVDPATITEPTGSDPGTIQGSHVYADNGSYAVTVKVTGADMTSVENTLSVDVANQPPSNVVLSAAPTVDENGTLALSGTFDDPGMLDTHTVLIDWGDGFPATSLSLTGGERNFSASHVYLDDVPTDAPSDKALIKVMVTDDDGGLGKNAVNVTLNNVPPSNVDISLSPSPANENDLVTLDGSFDDPGTLDSHQVAINWGDGSPLDIVHLTPGQYTFTADHRYLDDGLKGPPTTVYHVTANVSDDDHGMALGKTDLVVNNVAPSNLSVGLDNSTIDENGTVTLSGSFTDPGTKDTHSVLIDWGDGTTTPISLPENATTFSAVHQYLDDNPPNTPYDIYDIGVAVTDDDGGAVQGGTTVRVNNVAPADLTVGVTPMAISENGAVTLSGSFTEASPLDPHKVEINWGDGSANTVIPLAPGANTFSTTHAYLDDKPSGTSADSYPITVTVTDDDTGTITAQTTVDVLNVPPDHLVLSLAPVSIDENGTVTLQGTFDDPGSQDPHEIEIDWGDGSPPSKIMLPSGQNSFNIDHLFRDDGLTDSYTIQVQVSDDDLGSTSASTLVMVSNVAPEITSLTITPVFENQTATLTGSYSDQGPLDVHAIDIDWDGDGTYDETALPVMGGTFTFTHLYADDSPSGTPSDTFNVKTRLHDDDGGSDSEEVSQTVTNVDPMLNGLSATAIDEHGMTILTGTIADSGTQDVFSVDVNWQDGTPADTITGLGLTDSSGTVGGTSYTWIASTRSLTFTHQYLDDGTYPGNGISSDTYMVALTVTDDDTGTSSTTANVVVNNVAPNLINVTGSTIDEHGTATVTANVSDPGTKDVFSVDVNWQDGTPADTITGLGLTNSTGTVGGTSYTWVAATRSLTLSHPYLDDGTYPGNGNASDTYTVSLAVTDDDTGTSSTTASVVVNNVAPNLINVTGSTIDENGIATVTANISDPGTKDVFSIDVNWQDGTPADTIADLGLTDSSGTVGGTSYIWVASTRSLTLSHQYLDDGTYPGNGTSSDAYTVTLAVTDDDTGTSSATASVAVNNVDPNLINVVGSTINENGTATVTANISDPGTKDVFSADVDWQDGTPADTITGLGLTDSSGTVGGTSYTWVASTRSLTLTHLYLDDGTYPGNGNASDTYTVSLAVTDDDTGTSSTTANVVVNNVAPNLINVVGSTINENGIATVTASVADPGTKDVFSVDVNWQDGTPADTITGLGLVDSSGAVGGTNYTWVAATRSLTLSHQYLDDGIYPGNGTASDTYTVELAVTDDDTGTSNTTTSVVVNNVNPTLINVTGSTIDENGTATVTANVSDSGTKDVFSVDVNWQDGTPADTITGLGLTDSNGTVGGTSYTWVAATRNLTLTHPYLDDGTYPGNGTSSDAYTVALAVTDDDTGTSSATASVVVSNVAPTLVNVIGSTINENGTATVTANVSDPGTKDVFSVDVNWQDGTPADTITGLGLTDSSGTVGGTNYTWVAATRSLTLTRQYLDDGTYPGNGTAGDTYTVALAVTDDDTGTSSATANVVVNNVNPALVNVIGSTINENGTATVTANVSDPGTKDVFSVDVNWQDGTPADTITGLGLTDSSGMVGGTSYTWVAATRSLTLSHQYLDDGTYPGNGNASDTYAVSLAVTDDDTGTSSTTASVVVNNVAPNLIDVVGSTIDENGIATVTANISDPGTKDVFSVDVHWQDGTPADTITGLGLTDSSGTVGETSYTWVAATRSLTLTHQYLDDGTYPGNGTSSDTYTVALAVTDDDTGTSNATASVAVNNVEPTLINVTGSTINENGIATVTANVSDPGTKDVFSVDVNWQDGTSVDTITGLGLTDSSGTVGGTSYTWVAATRSLTLTHQYLDDGAYPGNGTASDTYTVALTVADDDTDTSSTAATVIVNNVNPNLINVIGSTINENGVATVTANVSDPGTKDAFSVDVNWQDGTPVDTITGLGLTDSSGTVGGTNYTWVAATRSLTLTHQYLDDGSYPGNGTSSDTYTVALAVTDDDAGTSSTTAKVVVNNINPDLINVTSSTINENSVATITANVSDPGTKDVFSVDVNWQDGTPPDTIANLGLTDASGTVGGTNYTWVASTRSLTLTHQYLDDGTYPGNGTASDTYTVALAVTDDDTGTSNTTTSVAVNNVNPNLINVTSSTINENGIATLTANVSDPGTKDVFSVDVNWQDGTSADTITGLGLTDSSGTVGGTSYTWAAATRSLTLTHQYLDDGTYPGNGTASDTYTVALAVTDDDIGTSSTTATVVVDNVAPNLINVTGSTINENGIATVTANVSDPGTKDVFSVDVNWQDGTPADTITGLGLTDSSGTVGGTNYTWVAATRSLTLTHQYLDDGTYPGNGTATDTYTVALAVTDDDIGTNTTTATVVVNNVAPNLINVTGSTINENGTATVTANVSDPGTKDVFSVDVNWQDDTPADTITGLGLTDSSGTVGGTNYIWVASTRSLTLTHQYLDDGTYPGNGTATDTYTVALAVTDDDTGTSGTTATVVVNNVNPSLVNVTGSTINENGTATVTANVSDPGTKDVFSVDVNWQDGTPTDTITGLGLTDSSGTVGGTSYTWVAATRNLTLTHQYLDDGAYPGNGTASDTYTVALAVTDDDTGTSSTTATVIVNNVTPNLINVTGSTINENGIATVTANVSDPGTKDVFSVDVNWQDSTPADTITGLGLTDSSGTVGGTSYTWVAATRSLTLTHQYLDDGVYPGNGTASDTYTVALAVTDDDLGTSSTTATVVVNNVDPTLINVTGSTINENGVATVSTNVIDPGTKDVFSVTVNWQDGTPADTITGLGLSNTSGMVGGTSYTWVAATRSLTLTHQYLDDGTYPGNGTASDTYNVSLALSDDDLGTDSATTQVVVNNVAPNLINVTGSTINENGVATVSTTISDPGTKDVFDVVVNWQDGTPADTISGLGLTDSSGTIGGTSYAWVASTRSLTLTHQYIDDGSYPGNGTASDTYIVSLDVADDDLGTGSTTATVIVNNVTPTLINIVGATIDEDSIATISTTVSDPGTQDVFSVVVDWQDGTPADTITGLGLSDLSGVVGGTAYTWTAATRSLTLSHQYLDDGPYPGNGTASDTYNVALKVADDDLGQSNSIATVIVNNVIPSQIVFTATPTTIDENNSISISGTFVDTGRQDHHTLMVDWGDGTAPESISTFTSANGQGTFTATHFYADDNVTGTPTDINAIRVFVTDDDNGTGVGQTNVTINDVAPIINTINATQLDTLGRTTMSLTFSDVGTQDSFTIVIDWADGLPPEQVTLAAGTTSFSRTHQYLAPPDPANPANDIPITVTVRDDDVLSATQVVLADVPGKQVFGSLIDLAPKGEPLRFPVLASVSSTPSQVPPPISTSRPLQDRTGFEVVVGADRRVILRTVSVQGEEGNELVLPEEQLDNLSSLFRRLPDGRYRIYLRQDKIERLILDVYIRQGKPVDPENENDGTRDRPPTSQSEPAGASQKSDRLAAEPVHRQPSATDQPEVLLDEIDWSKPARLLRELRRRNTS